jgi:hypothetical protein
VSSLVSVFVYFAVTPAEETVVTQSMAWRTVGGLCGAWIAVFCVFMAAIDSNYIGTFFSTDTGRDNSIKLFREGPNDECKVKMLAEHNPKKWSSIRGEVKVWTHANWARFEEEAPTWFTPGLVAHIDDELIPIVALARLNRAAGGHRRRSSLGGSVREAMTPSAASLRERSSARDRGEGGGARVAPTIDN